MPRHLIAHDIGLFQHLVGERIAAMRRSFIDDHRERGFHRMRQIADMRAGALD